MAGRDSTPTRFESATDGGQADGREADGGSEALSVSALVAKRVEALRADKGDHVAVSDIGEIVAALLETVGGDLSPEDVRLYHEIEDLARYIHAARAEISALNPADIREEFLPTAADELDAIVQSTEAATGEIMDATEAIEELVDSLPSDTAAAVRAATTRIYEACSFQDITGQRVTKVVRTLKSIGDRVDGLVRAFDPDRLGLAAGPGAEGDALHGATGSRPVSSAEDRRRVAAAGDRSGDDALLNGPQDDGKAIRQDDVDALLSRFD